MTLAVDLSPSFRLCVIAEEGGRPAILELDADDRVLSAEVNVAALHKAIASLERSLRSFIELTTPRQEVPR